MKERRKNVQKFTLLSDDLTMESSSVEAKIMLNGVSATTSGDEGFEDLPIDSKKDEVEISVRSCSPMKPPLLKSSRQPPLKKRSKEKQSEEAVIIPRRRKTRQLPPRTSSRGSNNVLLTVELNSDCHKPGPRQKSRADVSTKERVLGSHEKTEDGPDLGSLRAAALNHIDANRDRLFGGEPEPKVRPYLRTSHRKRRPKPGDNSEKNICWWVSVNEDDIPKTPVPHMRPNSSAGPSTAMRELLSGSQSPSSSSSTSSQSRHSSAYKLHDLDTGKRLFGKPEPGKPCRQSRPGDASHSRLFGCGKFVPPRPNTASDLRLNTKDRLFGETYGTSSKPPAKVFPGKSPHENIFPTNMPRDVKTKGSQSARQANAVNRNPIIGVGIQNRQVRPTTGCAMSNFGSNPITGEGYRPGRRDIHAVTCRI